MFSVTYWTIYKDGKVAKTTNAACFSSLPSQDAGIKMIRYLLPISDKLDDEKVDFYLDFLNKTFVGRPYSYKRILLKKKRYIHFSLDTTDWNKYHVLVYLSAIRILDEMAEIVVELFKNKHEKYDTQFIKFQDIHKQVCDGEIKFEKNESLHTLNCHGLFYASSYGGGTCRLSEYKPITYELYKDRLEKKTSESVHGYFSPIKEPAPAPKVEQVVKAADLYVNAKPVKPLRPRKPIEKLVKNEAIFA